MEYYTGKKEWWAGMQEKVMEVGRCKLNPVDP
jgi:hypothetical protein